MPDPVTGLVFFVVFLMSTTLHEAAHAWAAKHGGDLTAYHGGQVSLDSEPGQGTRVRMALPVNPGSNGGTAL